MNQSSINQIVRPVLAIIVSEILIFSGYPIYGLTVHIINLLYLTFLIIGVEHFYNIYKYGYLKPVFQSFILLLLLRIINMATPIFFIPSIFWISIIYGIMFIPIYLLLKHQDFTLKEIGLQCDRLNIFHPFYVLAALFMGCIFAVLEYQIIQPEAMVDSLSVPNFIVLVLIMFFFVAGVEELVFRSILQTRLEQAIGLKQGLLVTSMLFGIMHSGYGTVYEIFLTGFAGLIIGYIFQKTRCLPFVVWIHGIINIFVFGILPIIL